MPDGVVDGLKSSEEMEECDRVRVDVSRGREASSSSSSSSSSMLLLLLLLLLLFAELFLTAKTKVLLRRGILRRMWREKLIQSYTRPDTQFYINKYARPDIRL